ncbi:SAM-dependent methyltransferase [Pseudonocardia abyssalis]|uniref:Class I SAM-dependent methyltransferase n=1 Tax=Pseudonocardia abyssalis TaxID=2792008 RepID=A0ABS6UNJ7_9PSEU|nr:cyclopropane-fatty-acyl-phospholipid synthase family protein [Pseudonocardia abyssalis]MBW0116350.1 class I SAM-dependent methyltransferase [Pseudonocardia abyssalis]MBW0133526.1 class I SAM-dependent methyltransferase [Pseudonocardia abyssalis]
MQVAEIISSVLGADVPVRIIGYDGSKAGPDSAEAAIRITSPRAMARLVTAPGTLGLARGYVTGEIEVEGELYGILAAMPDVILHDISRAQRVKLARQLVPVWLKHRMPPPEFEFVPPGRLHSRARDRKVISHHYDVSNTFYEWVLGPSMAYTCAVYPTATATLEEAQAEKHELVSQKLALAPGMRLLDVGCGWGGMVMHAAAEHGVKALGVTLSANQAAWAQAEITRRGLDDLAEVRHVDYRDAPETEFDAISSIGLTEHIGRAQLPSYFASLHARLKPGGRLLNHCITESRTPARRLDPFIGRYIFPDGELHTVGHVIGTMNDAGFEIRHEENFREHYARTLHGWGDNLEAHWDEAVAEVGIGKAKVWRLYMAACRLGFERDNIQLHQVLGERVHGDGRSGFPLRGW